jgi:hypothetical protein
VATLTAAADGGTAPEHTVDDSGLHQRYFSSQYDPTGGHKYDVSRNHDLYISAPGTTSRRSRASRVATPGGAPTPAGRPRPGPRTTTAR